MRVCGGRGFRGSPPTWALSVRRRSSPLRLGALRVGPEPDHGLACGIEEFGRHLPDLVRREALDDREQVIETAIGLAVQRRARPTIHPRGRTLQTEHPLAHRLPLRLA